MFYRGFQNLVVHQPIMLFVTEYHFEKILKEGDIVNVDVTALKMVGMETQVELLRLEMFLLKLKN